jgi:hypothetical protein
MSLDEYLEDHVDNGHHQETRADLPHAEGQPRVVGRVEDRRIGQRYDTKTQSHHDQASDGHPQRDHVAERPDMFFSRHLRINIIHPLVHLLGSDNPSSPTSHVLRANKSGEVAGRGDPAARRRRALVR